MKNRRPQQRTTQKFEGGEQDVKTDSEQVTGHEVFDGLLFLVAGFEL